ncbi:18361_t:CDS:2, partial [Racocetra fulgida]
NSSLHKLSYYGNEAGLVGGEVYFANVILENKSLTHLNLSSNDLKCKGKQIINALFKQFIRDISGTYIESEGFEFI